MYKGLVSIDFFLLIMDVFLLLGVPGNFLLDIVGFLPSWIQMYFHSFFFFFFLNFGCAPWLQHLLSVDFLTIATLTSVRW